MSKAVRIDRNGGPEELKIVDVEVGDPGPGEIRIRHKALGLNFIDTYQRSGLTGFVAGVARTSKLASANVTINNLLPGSFDTDRLKVTMEGGAKKSGQPVEAVAEARKKTIPARRFGTAEEFGAICAFLCSTHAAYMTGQNVLADGGAYPGTY